MADDNAAMIAALRGQDAAAMQPETFANPLVTKMLGDAATLPQRAIQNSQFALDTGTYDPSTPVEAATHLMGAGVPMAESGAAGIFGGKLATTADLRALKEAESMRMGGKHPDQVWQDTGWFRHPADQQWRFEIPDNEMKLNYMPTSEGDTATAIHAHHMIHHPELFEAYPQLKGIQTSVTKDSRFPTGQGMYFPDEIKAMEAMGPNADVVTNVLAHELQHGVQDIENFSWGTSPSHYAGLIEKGLRKDPSLLGEHDFMTVVNQANKLYKGTAGEVEARNVQNRLDWNPIERRYVAPWHSQDVPFAEQYHHDPVTGMVKALKK